MKKFSFVDCKNKNNVEKPVINMALKFWHFQEKWQFLIRAKNAGWLIGIKNSEDNAHTSSSESSREDESPKCSFSRYDFAKTCKDKQNHCYQILSRLRSA